jgi:hypothetical protein
MFFLQLTLSLESKDFVSATVAHQSVSMSPTSSIGMCIKPRDENMQIATFYGCGRTDGSVTISLRNFVGEGINTVKPVKIKL